MKTQYIKKCAVLREKFIALYAYTGKEMSQINDLSFHLKKLVGGKEIKSRVGRWKEIIKIREEISEMENRKK